MGIKKINLKLSLIILRTDKNMTYDPKKCKYCVLNGDGLFQDNDEMMAYHLEFLVKSILEK
jgi:hypothetical protein